MKTLLKSIIYRALLCSFKKGNTYLLSFEEIAGRLREAFNIVEETKHGGEYRFKLIDEENQEYFITLKRRTTDDGRKAFVALFAAPTAGYTGRMRNIHISDYLTKEALEEFIRDVQATIGRGGQPPVLRVKLPAGN